MRLRIANKAGSVKDHVVLISGVAAILLGVMSGYSGLTLSSIAVSTTLGCLVLYRCLIRQQSDDKRSNRPACVSPPAPPLRVVKRQLTRNQLLQRLEEAFNQHELSDIKRCTSEVIKLYDGVVASALLLIFHNRPQITGIKQKRDILIDYLLCRIKQQDAAKCVLTTWRQPWPSHEKSMVSKNFFDEFSLAELTNFWLAEFRKQPTLIDCQYLYMQAKDAEKCVVATWHQVHDQDDKVCKKLCDRFSLRESTSFWFAEICRRPNLRTFIRILKLQPQLQRTHWQRPEVVSYIIHLVFSLSDDIQSLKDLVYLLFKNKIDFSACSQNFSDYLPKNIHSISLYAFLSYYDLQIDDVFYQYCQKQKLLAMSLGLTGSSRLQQVVIYHEFLVMIEVYWRALKQYCHDHKEWRQYAHHMLCDHTFNADNMKLRIGAPVVLPSYRTDGMGSSHVATVGLLRLTKDLALVVDADKGMGRSDWCVYLYEGCMSVDNVYAICGAKGFPASLLMMYESKGVELLDKKELKAQKGDFCARISAEYAIFIGVYLGCIRDAIRRDFECSARLIEFVKEIVKLHYSPARNQFKKFKRQYQQCWFEEYKQRPPEMQDRDFLIKSARCLDKRMISHAQ